MPENRKKIVLDNLHMSACLYIYLLEKLAQNSNVVKIKKAA